MPTAELPDPDETFRALMQDVDIPIPTDVVNVALLNEAELNTRLTQIKQELYNLKEMWHPRTEKGRDLHSQRNAITVEMRKRGLMD